MTKYIKDLEDKGTPPTQMWCWEQTTYSKSLPKYLILN